MEHPYARSKDVMEKCDVSRPTAAKWLRALVATGALQEMKVGREVLFVNVEMMKVLTS